MNSLKITRAVSIVCIPFCLILLAGTLNAQCTEQQPSQNASGNSSNGQSFIPDCSGAISTISMLTNSTAATTIDLVIKDLNCNVLWTVLNLPLASSSMVEFDISGGSGITRNVTVGNTYSFHLSNADNSVIFRGNSVSGYTDGCFMTAACTCISSFDFLFIMEIEEAVLPVEFAAFSASPAPGYVQLDWQTASESNNIGFEVERSESGLIWSKIGFVAGNGTTNRPASYSYQDYSPATGERAYYRLKQRDADGEYQYSSIQLVTFKTEVGSVSIYPNPATNQIFINGLDTEQEFSVIDRTGKELLTTITANRIDISQLPSGIYYLRRSTDNGFVLKFVKR